MHIFSAYDVNMDIFKLFVKLLTFARYKQITFEKKVMYLKIFLMKYPSKMCFNSVKIFG